LTRYSKMRVKTALKDHCRRNKWKAAIPTNGTISRIIWRDGNVSADFEIKFSLYYFCYKCSFETIGTISWRISRDVNISAD
jgi:hypothetical protein